MRREFRMPDAGEGLTEAEIVVWQVAVGDEVAVNQVLVEIETAKAVVELPSPYAGTVGALLAEPGQTVAVGVPIIAIETAEAGGVIAASGDGSVPGERSSHTAILADPAVAGAGAPARAADAGAKIGEAGADGRIATLVGYGPRPGTVARRPRRSPSPQATPAEPGSVEDQRIGTRDRPEPGSGFPAADHPGAGPAHSADDQQSGTTHRAEPGSGFPAADHVQPGNGLPDGPTTGTGAAGRAPGGLVPLAKPPVRKLARDLGIDLHALTGSGAGGVITREDVQAFVQQPAEPAAAVPSTTGERREPIRGVRKATAAAMVASAFSAPHVTEFLTVDLTATMALRERLRGTREYADVPLSPLAFVAKAVCLAARRTPVINASWDEAAGEIVYHGHVQLGIAAATPRGLIVPKIRDADGLTLLEMARALGELTTTARTGRTPPADLTGGTFTITNVGVFGVDTGTPIINPGEAAILAVGSIKPAPWVVDGELVVRTVCQLALSFDHRLVDGEQGSRFLVDVGALLAEPGLALTW